MSIQQQRSSKVLLIGDSCLDYYHFGKCERLSPEAPVPVLKEEKIEVKEGMSLNVKNNLEAFGLKVTHLTNPNKIEKHRLVDKKTNYQIARFDVNESKELEQISLCNINPNNYDCLIISDYCKGTISKEVAIEACEIFKEKPVFVDSKKRDLSCYSDCYIKINEFEKSSLIKGPINSNFIVTVGKKGALYGEKMFETENVEVFDVCGAGDVFLASLVNAFLICKQIERSIIYANKLATRSVTKFGTYVVTRGDINDFCI